MIFRRQRSFQLVIVLEVASLYEKRGQTLVELISRLHKLFGKDFAELADSSCLVITKLSA